MHTKRTNALIFSNLSIITKGNKKRADKITFSTFRKKTMLRLSMEIAPRLQKLLLFAYLCFTGQQKEKQPMKYPRKPGNEPHVHCPAYNLIRNSSNKAYY